MTAPETTDSRNNAESIGQRLRAAREAKGVTPADVCKATNMMEKHILSMEDDDFAAMGAAIYTKGFIKLYAEYLGLNAQQLVDEYTRRYLRKKKPSPPAAPAAAPKKPRQAPAKNPQSSVRPPANDELKKISAEAFRKARELTGSIPKEKLRRWGLNAGISLVLMAVIILLVFGIRSCVSSIAEKRAGTERSQQSLDAVIEEPPAPYLNE
jgi:transcriptional regulator with XRE-family HTH domain